MAEVNIRDLLEGWDPFWAQTGVGIRRCASLSLPSAVGFYIIDLQKTVAKIEEPCKVVSETARSGKSILFVGTKKQAADIVRQEAERCEQYFVTDRWLGGMLTNWPTIRQSIRHLDHLDRISADGTYEKLKKKEVLL